MTRRLWGAVVAVLLALSAATMSTSTNTAQADDPAGSCAYNSHTTSGHCYSIIQKSGFTGVTEIWEVLRTRCMYVPTTATDGSHTNNEIWAISPTGDYVEFGHIVTDPTPSGYPQKHWFWERHIGGAWNHYNINSAWTAGTLYNATILYTGTGSTGWQFKQGGALFGSGGGNYPYGPIYKGQAGAEGAYDGAPNSAQDSIDDQSGGRYQNGVTYSNWGGGVTEYASAGPFQGPVWGDAGMRNLIPTAPLGGGGGTC
ncbi:MAG TPA: hypothetical protein VI322_03580 [Candidatus Saccharimonadia bacterium]